MRLRFVLLAMALALAALPAFSHLPELVKPVNGGPPAPSRWDQAAFPITWSLNSQHPGSNVQGSRTVADVIQASFNTWTAAPNTALNVTRTPDTSVSSAQFDGVNLICFTCSGDFSREAETLAVTISTMSDAPGENTKHNGTSSFAGQILDADILFNPNVKYSTDGSGSGQDLQTVAVHEIGHFFGLDHSAVVRALMFPFAPPVEHTLSYDDAAGIATLYPKPSADVATGSISGTVSLSGSPVFGAHVFADSVTGNDPLGGFGIRRSPVGTLTLPDGTYIIRGVPPDSYTVTAEPLNEPVTSTDVSDYGPAYGKSIQTNFTTRWH